MKIYSSKIINDYISGNDIENFNIEELEKDPNFMKEVIKATNDKKMYNMCDDTIKKDYTFVSSLIELFKEDEEFICNISDYFLDNNENEKDEFELCILLANYCKSKKNKSKYESKAKILSYKERVSYIIYISEDKTSPLNESYNLGFLYALIIHENRPLIINYIAKDMIEEIFEDCEDFNLEQMLHKRFSKSRSLEEIGIKNYIINYISGYDDFLSQHVQSHPELIKDIEKRVERIISNWNSYNKRIIDCILDEIHVFATKELDFALGEHGLIEYLYKRLDIKELKNEIIEDEYSDQTEEFMQNDIRLLNESEKRTLEKFEKRILKIYKERILSNTYDQKEELHKSKLIHFDPKNN